MLRIKDVMRTKDNEKNESMTALDIESDRLAAISRGIDDKKKSSLLN